MLRLTRKSIGPAILQRLPILTHLCIIPISLFGPTYTPHLFVLILISVHLALWNVNIRSIYGAYCAWRGIQEQSKTDPLALHASILRETHHLPVESIEHLIIIPNYAEHPSILRQTLHLLSTHPMAYSTYHPILAMEARESGSINKAIALIDEFKSQFKGIGWTLHPEGIDGQVGGKGSNLAWAASQAWGELQAMGDIARIERTIVTVIDSDTALAADYFSTVASRFAIRTPAERKRMTFAPPIVFDRNASSVPVTVRLTDILWSLAGLSTIYPTSEAKIPTSAYSLSLSLLASAGFHDPGPNGIGEDMHTFIKCLFATRGNLISETVYSPASSLDVVAAERGGLGGLWRDHKARYAQALRHMWGSLDTGYGVGRLVSREFAAGQDEHDVDPSTLSPTFTGTVYGGDPGDRMMRLDTARPRTLVRTGSACQTSTCTSSSASSTKGDTDDASSVTSRTSISTNDGFDWSENKEDVALLPVKEDLPLQIGPFLTLLGRLYDAHLLMGHMTLLITLRAFTPARSGLLAPPSIFLPMPTHEILSDSAKIVEWAYLFTDRMRSYTLIMTIIALIFYDRFHQWSVLYRWQIAGDRLGEQSEDRSLRSCPWSMLDYFALPGGIIFGVIPIIHAQVMHLFTNKLTYTVSIKPLARALDRRRGRSASNGGIDTEKGYLE